MQLEKVLLQPDIDKKYVRFLTPFLGYLRDPSDLGVVLAVLYKPNVESGEYA